MSSLSEDWEELHVKRPTDSVYAYESQSVLAAAVPQSPQIAAPATPANPGPNQQIAPREEPSHEPAAQPAQRSASDYHTESSDEDIGVISGPNSDIAETEVDDDDDTESVRTVDLEEDLVEDARILPPTGKVLSTFCSWIRKSHLRLFPVVPMSVQPQFPE